VLYSHRPNGVRGFRGSGGVQPAASAFAALVAGIVIGFSHVDYNRIVMKSIKLTVLGWRSS